MRQYDDPVEVRRGEAEDPDQFLWRGRLWKVRAVVAHWVEAGPWRQGATTSERSGAPAGERELWRVEAGRGLRVADGDGYGVFDLSLDWADGRWQLVGSQD
jgi:Family of unknown function (DUF6504)